MHKVVLLVMDVVYRARTFDFSREEGQGAVEYALVVLGVAAVIGVAIGGFGTKIKDFMTGAGNSLQTWIP